MQFWQQISAVGMAHPFRQRMKGSNGYKMVSFKKSVGTFHPLASLSLTPRLWLRLHRAATLLFKK
jgi:hypothetical protein